MPSRFRTLAILSCALASTPTIAASLADPAGDFNLPFYTGPADADLDVTNFGVLYNPGLLQFTLTATFAGAIDSTKPGFYVIGANTGTGTIAPFGAIGAPNVRFNQAVTIQKTGVATIGGVALTGGPAIISGNSLTALVSLAELPSTGFLPQYYGFNIWPRAAGITGGAAVSDFAPDNALLAAVPEPATWATMLVGFGAVGMAVRRGRRGGTRACAI